jgi:hypothetical protein
MLKERRYKLNTLRKMQKEWAEAERLLLQKTRSKFFKTKHLKTTCVKSSNAFLNNKTSIALIMKSTRENSFRAKLVLLEITRPQTSVTNLKTAPIKLSRKILKIMR